MKLLRIAITLLSAISFSIAGKMQAITIGPVFSYNFGKATNSYSWGIEMAYWTEVKEGGAREHLHGFDIGFEIDKSKNRLYAEYQNGYIVYGGSFGMVVQIENESTEIGIQGGAWGSLIGGLNIRSRYMINGGYCLSPGLFIKLPYIIDEGSHGDDWSIFGDGMM